MWVPPLMDEHEVRKKKIFFHWFWFDGGRDSGGRRQQWRHCQTWPSSMSSASYEITSRATHSTAEPQKRPGIPVFQQFSSSYFLCVCVCVCVCVFLRRRPIHSFVIIPFFFAVCVFFFRIHPSMCGPKTCDRAASESKPHAVMNSKARHIFQFFFVCVFCCLSVSVCVCVCVRWVCVLGGHTHTHTHTQKHVPEGVIVQRERERECHSNEPLNKIIKKKRKEKKKRQKKKKERRETRLVS